MPSHISQLTYAIGDIHGYDDHFARLIDRIRSDAERIGEKPRIVLLGDYVDRGPASRQVLDRVLRLEAETWCESHSRAITKKPCCAFWMNRNSAIRGATGAALRHWPAMA
jgi:hypothetical protein